MIIHEYTNYYDKKQVEENKQTLLKLFDNTTYGKGPLYEKVSNISDIKKYFYHGSKEEKDEIKRAIHSIFNTHYLFTITRKERNSLQQFVKELGLKDSDIFDKHDPKPRSFPHGNEKEAISNAIKSKDLNDIKDKIKKVSAETVLGNQSKERYGYLDRLITAEMKHNPNMRDVRKKTVMKEWEQRNQKWKAKHDREKRRKILMGGSIGLAGAGTAYIAARKLAKLKGLENKYARKLLLLPPNKRSFIQKMLDKIRALIRKYKH